LKTYFIIISNDRAYFGYKKKIFKCKYLTTNREEVIIDDAAGNVTVIIVHAVAVVVDVVDAVELQSMFEN
jgi:hypothetical protein